MNKIEFQEYKGENDIRINKVKTTKRTTSFNRKTIKKVVPPDVPGENNNVSKINTNNNLINSNQQNQITQQEKVQNISNINDITNISGFNKNLLP